MNCGDSGFGKNLKKSTDFMAQGRFPANLIHDGSEEVRECFPDTTTGGGVKLTGEGANNNVRFQNNTIKGKDWKSDSGNASRYFKSIKYCPKASKKERNAGCEGLENKKKVFNGQSDKPSKNMKDVEKRFSTHPTKNNHPTCKPIALMEYLIKMITPKGGIVLDPFAGSGTTGLACKNLKHNYILIEKESEYIKIIKERLKN